MTYLFHWDVIGINIDKEIQTILSDILNYRYLSVKYTSASNIITFKIFMYIPLTGVCKKILNWTNCGRETYLNIRDLSGQQYSINRGLGKKTKRRKPFDQDIPLSTSWMHMQFNQRLIFLLGFFWAIIDCTHKLLGKIISSLILLFS